MHKRTLKVALLVTLAVIMVFSLTSVALAAPWKDLPNTVTAKYDITEAQVAEISDGFANGLWKPYQNVTREQFVKMAVAAFEIPLANPANATYSDVAKGSYYYQYIEGATAAGMTNGFGGATFKPKDAITREQAIAIVVRWVAKANGYTLATQYTAAQITALLAPFGDAAAVNLKPEVAFAIDFGITEGNAFGNLAPAANMWRIQGAAFLIRATTMIPAIPVKVTKLEIVGTDKTENLIGQNHMVTFKATKADGSAAVGALIDFDTLFNDAFYVGNISPQAAVTNNFGEVTVNLISHELGTQKVSASAPGLAAVVTTKYWLGLDEVYTVGATAAQNNAGTPHEWGTRVVVFGPGPRSTSDADWYNAVSTATFDPTSVKVLDGVDATDDPALPAFLFGNGWTYADELVLTTAKYAPRTMAGINVEWSIVNVTEEIPAVVGPPAVPAVPAVPSVGKITAVDGTAITPALTATGVTDAAGFSKIKIESTVTGATRTMAVANYAGNPYPKLLVNHLTINPGYALHTYNWFEQPSGPAVQLKTWISHTLPGSTSPIAPASVTANIGEEKTLTITLVDTFGNPISGRQVEWFMQGVGFFNTDDANDTSDQFGPNSKDFDVTNAAGKATVFVKSYKAGEQIVHAKVRDKGTGGAEGQFVTYDAEVQWFDVDVATFDNPATALDEAVSTNPVGTTHDFTLWAKGLKLELDPNINNPVAQTRYIDGDLAGSSYDGIFDAKDATYFGGILLVNPADLPQSVTTITAGSVTSIAITNVGAGYIALPTVTISAPNLVGGTQATAIVSNVVLGSVTAITITNPGSGYTANPTVTISASPGTTATATATANFTTTTTGNFTLDANGVVLTNTAPATAIVQGHTMTLSYVGGYTRYDVDADGDMDNFTGLTGIYMPLAGKTVTFAKAVVTPNVGSITAPTAAVLTDATGAAPVTVSSTVKGPERIIGSVTWQGNPNAPKTAPAQKTWVAGTGTTLGLADLKVSVWIDGKQVADNTGAIASQGKAAFDPATLLLNSAHVEVHVQDLLGNELPDYEVVYLLNSIGTQISAATYSPLAYLFDDDPDNNLPLVNPVDDFDANDARPDSNEPTPASDPYAAIVGPGGTEAFFFNQWLGAGTDPTLRAAAGQAGIPYWASREFGNSFTAYTQTYADYLAYQILFPVSVPWTVDSLSGSVDPAVLPANVPLATDGAKAWTLDGFRLSDGLVVPNLLTGSNIDIQLADNFIDAEPGTTLFESLLRVMIYSPAAGLVTEGTPLYSTQVHMIWAVPVATTVTISPATDISIAGIESQSVTATVKDQFGNPMANQLVTFSATNVKSSTGTPLTFPAGVAAQVTTNALGIATLTWSEPNGSWGTQRVNATAGAASTVLAPSTIMWAYNDTAQAYITAVAAENKVGVLGTAGTTFPQWDGKTVTAILNGVVLGSGIYQNGVDLAITTTHTNVVTDGWFLRFALGATDLAAPDYIWTQPTP